MVVGKRQEPDIRVDNMLRKTGLVIASKSSTDLAHLEIIDHRFAIEEVV